MHQIVRDQLINISFAERRKSGWTKSKMQVAKWLSRVSLASFDFGVEQRIEILISKKKIGLGDN